MTDIVSQGIIVSINAEQSRRALFSQEGDPPTFIDPPKAHLAWISSLPVPSDLKDFLVGLSLQDEFGIGTNAIHTPDEIVSANTEFRYIVDGGFVIIGAAVNGDMVGNRIQEHRWCHRIFESRRSLGLGLG